MTTSTNSSIAQQANRFGVDGRLLRVRPKHRIELSTLTAAGRNQIDDSNFALPGRRYPIHDLAHARAALSRVAQHGTPEEKAKVRAAVYRKYPQLKKSQTDLSAPGVWQVVELSKGDHDSSTHPDLPNKAGKTNWVEQQGGLPSFIKRVAKHIMADGKLSESHAIAAAVQQCRDGRFGAKGLAAYAEFRAKAAAARAS